MSSQVATNLALVASDHFVFDVAASVAWVIWFVHFARCDWRRSAVPPDPRDRQKAISLRGYFL